MVLTCCWITNMRKYWMNQHSGLKRELCNVVSSIALFVPRIDLKKAQKYVLLLLWYRFVQSLFTPCLSPLLDCFESFWYLQCITYGSNSTWYDDWHIRTYKMRFQVISPYFFISKADKYPVVLFYLGCDFIPLLPLLENEKMTRVSPTQVCPPIEYTASAAQPL